MREATLAYLYCAACETSGPDSQLCTWQIGADKIGHTFARFALPMTWDFVEVVPWADSSGGYGLEHWIGLHRSAEHLS